MGMDTNTENLIVLLDKIRCGDNNAIEVFVDAVFPMLYKNAYYYLKDSMSAEDVVTDTIYKVIAGNTKGIKNIIGWMLVIVKNRCLDIIKKRNRVVYIDDIQKVMDERDSTTPDWLEKLHIEQCLASLDERERQMLLLEYYGYTMKESIQLLGITTAQGRRLLKKAQENFKKNYVK